MLGLLGLPYPCGRRLSGENVNHKPGSRRYHHNTAASVQHTNRRPLRPSSGTTPRPHLCVSEAGPPAPGKVIPNLRMWRWAPPHPRSLPPQEGVNLESTRQAEAQGQLSYPSSCVAELRTRVLSVCRAVGPQGDDAASEPTSPTEAQLRTSRGSGGRETTASAAEASCWGCIPFISSTDRSCSFLFPSDRSPSLSVRSQVGASIRPCVGAAGGRRPVSAAHDLPPCQSMLHTLIVCFGELLVSPAGLKEDY